MAWWKDFAQFEDLEESPLSIRHHSFLIGHGSALKFANTAIADGKIAMVVGPAGLGKSSLAKHLARDIEDHRVILLNAKKHAGDVFSLEKYLRQPFFSFSKQPASLLVDEANLLVPTMIDRLFYYYDEAAQEKNGIKSIILFQVDSELRNASLPNRTRIAATHTLQTLSTEEIVDIIEARLAGIDVVEDEALCAIILREGHNPRNVLLQLDSILEAKGGKIGLCDVEEKYAAEPDVAVEEAVPSQTLDESRISRIGLPFHLSELQHTIVRHLLLAGSGSVGSIADAIGNPYGSVGKQLHLLHKKGIVTKRSQSRPVLYLLAQDAKDALMTD